LIRNPVAIQQQGEQKTVLAREAWRMNRWFKTHYVPYHRSPIVCVFHTWVLAEGSSKGRIREMGGHTALGWWRPTQARTAYAGLAGLR